MNKWLSASASVGLAIMTAGGLTACNHDASADNNAQGANSAAPTQGAASATPAPAPAPQQPAGPQYADVISATPIKKTLNNPTKECHNVTVTHHKPVKDEHQIAGTAIGAIAGGLLGHQVGGGKGKTLATVAGAIGGGYAGKKVQERHQEDATYTTTEQQCSTVNHSRTTVVGYTVKYRYKGVVHTARMDHNPGDRVKVSEGVSISDAN